MQYAHVKNMVVTGTDAGGNATVTMPAEMFRQLLATALRSKGALDEQFYMTINADIRDAVKAGKIASAAEHYHTTGYFEDRMPKKLIVDERYYLDQNPDVAAAIRKGVIKSAQEHFEFAGFREGRLPYREFSLF